MSYQAVRLHVVRDLRKSGLTYAAIGRQFGVTRQCIQQLIKKADQPYEPKGWITPIRVEDIAAMKARLSNGKTRHGHMKLAFGLPETASILGIGHVKLSDLFAVKELLSIHIGRRHLVPRVELERFINRLAAHRTRG